MRISTMTSADTVGGSYDLLPAAKTRQLQYAEPAEYRLPCWGRGRFQMPALREIHVPKEFLIHKDDHEVLDPSYRRLGDPEMLPVFSLYTAAASEDCSSSVVTPVETATASQSFEQLSENCKIRNADEIFYSESSDSSSGKPSASSSNGRDTCSVEYNTEPLNHNNDNARNCTVQNWLNEHFGQFENDQEADRKTSLYEQVEKATPEFSDTGLSRYQNGLKLQTHYRNSSKFRDSKFPGGNYGVRFQNHSQDRADSCGLRTTNHYEKQSSQPCYSYGQDSYGENVFQEEEFPELSPPSRSVATSVAEEQKVKPNFRSAAGVIAQFSRPPEPCDNLLSSSSSSSSHAAEADDTGGASSKEADILVIENIPKNVQSAELESVIQGYGEVDKILYCDNGRTLTAEIIMRGEPDWAVECLDGSYLFSASDSSPLRCYLKKTKS